MTWGYPHDLGNPHICIYIWYVYTYIYIYSDMSNFADTGMIIWCNWFRETLWSSFETESVKNSFVRVSKWFVALSPETDSEWNNFTSHRAMMCFLSQNHDPSQHFVWTSWWVSAYICNCGGWVPPKLKVPPFYMEVDHVLQLGKNTCPWFMLYGHCGYWILSVLSTEFFTVPLISHVGIKCGFGFLAVTCSCRKPFFTWYRFCPFKRVFLFSISGSFLWESSVGISRKYRWHMLFAFSLTQLWL